MLTVFLIYFLVPTIHGLDRVIFMTLATIILGLVTALLAGSYFLLKKPEIVKVTWQWKACALAPIIIPIGLIPDVLELIKEEFFLSINVLMLSQSSAVLAVSIWNFTKLNRAVKLMLTN